MNAIHRTIAAASTVLLAIAAPAAATAPEPTPPSEPPDQVLGTPPSTHGAFLPLPEEFFAPETLPLCGSEVTITQEEVEPVRYRARVDEDGDTVVEYRGVIALDSTRASDGATLQDVLPDSSPIETYGADGLTATVDAPGSAMVIATEDVQIQALADAGLPQAFSHLSGRLVLTTTLDSVAEPGREPPALADVEIVENTTEYVVHVCDLLGQAAAEEVPDL